MSRGYNSDLDIGIGQMPEIKNDPQVFNSLQEVYNALHLLNAGLNQMRRSYDCAEDSAPYNCFTFENRSFWAEVEEGVEEGNIVSWRGAGDTGLAFDTSAKIFRPGVIGYGINPYEGNVDEYFSSGTPPARKRWPGPFGIVLEDRNKKTGKALIGWPPGIVRIEGLEKGTIVYAKQEDPTIYTVEAFRAQSLVDIYPIGMVVGEESLLLDPQVFDHTRNTAYVPRYP